MWALILGLIIFLGAHSVRIFAEGWRRQQIVRLGHNTYRGLYALVSIIGFALIVWGFGLARGNPTVIYTTPVWLKHLNALFTIVAFVLVAAAYVPNNTLKEKIGHPMLAGIKLWALGHLLAIGGLRDVILFGSFLVWAIVDFASSRRRDRRDGVVYAKGTRSGNVIAVSVGLVLWVAFAVWLHVILIGVSPFV